MGKRKGKCVVHLLGVSDHLGTSPEQMEARCSGHNLSDQGNQSLSSSDESLVIRFVPLVI